MVRVIEPCSHSGKNKTIVCHKNNTYNYAEVFTVSIIKKNIFFWMKENILT